MKQWIKSLFKAGRLLSSDDRGNFRSGSFTYQGQGSANGQIYTPYGFIHNPPDGSLAFMFSQNGQNSNLIAMVSDPKNRKKTLNKGEAGIENQVTGSYILMDSNGDVEINAPASVNIVAATDLTVTIGAMVLTVNNSGINVTGGDIVADGVSLKSHVHSGVTTGGSNTGAPV